ncbi:MAG: glycosyltransferase family 4 protein [bacterium]|nr:glycosyltransferase family 4 protein [bacterium]
MISASFLPVVGGVQFQVKYQAEAIAKEGVELFFLSFADGERFLDKDSRGFPQFIRLKKRNPLAGAFELLALIKKISPDVIHVQSAEMQAFQVAFLKLIGLIKQPFIITSYGVDIMTSKEIGYGFRLKPHLNLIIRFILRKAAKHVIIGKLMQTFALEAGSAPDKIIEINNAVSLEKKEISNEKSSGILEKFSITPETTLLFSLSGMRPLKGLEYLVQAMPLIIKEFPKAKLILVGKSDDEYEKYIRALVKSLKIENYVDFVGFITDEDEKIVLLRRTDIFCKPSILEACSIAILEAMREGRVVVASVPGGIDIINDNENGLLVQVKSPEDFAEKTIRVLKDKDERAKIEAAAREHVKNFDIKKIASQYVALYNDIAHENPHIV